MSAGDALPDSSASSADENPDVDELSQPITSDPSETIMASINVPRMFHSFIAKSSIARNLGCQLIFPSHNMEPTIKIAANNQETIEKAKQSITDLVSSTRSRLRPTHFICLPIQNEAAIESYKSFKNKLLENSTENPLYKDIDEDLFMSEYKLHFSLATLLLADQEDIEKASRILETFKESEAGGMLSTDPLRITIRGLKVMQENPKCSHVLYATIQQDGEYERLQAIANSLTGIYRKEGLHSGTEDTSSPPQDVKLHMTLLNSRNRLEKQLRRAKKSERRRLRRQPFDAEALLSEFGEYCFAEDITIDCLKLCRMRSTAPDGFYQIETEVKLADKKNNPVTL
ncbi:hypothetical protein Aperf_G00000048990 [Anoplocephala perfoliata]